MQFRLDEPNTVSDPITRNYLYKLIKTLRLNFEALDPPNEEAQLNSYALCRSSAQVTFGEIVDGTTLSPSDGENSGAGTSLTGTWKAMGETFGANQVTLFLRLS